MVVVSTRLSQGRGHQQALVETTPNVLPGHGSGSGQQLNSATLGQPSPQIPPKRWEHRRPWAGLELAGKLCGPFGFCYEDLLQLSKLA